jgi:hypothetical protein
MRRSPHGACSEALERRALVATRDRRAWGRSEPRRGAFDADAGFSDRSHIAPRRRSHVMATARALRATLRDVERARAKVRGRHLRHL